MDITSLRSLADLAKPELAERALRFFCTRAGEKPTPQTQQLSQLVVTIARHSGVEKAVLDKLRAYLHGLRPKQHGLSSRNRERLPRADTGRSG